MPDGEGARGARRIMVLLGLFALMAVTGCGGSAVRTAPGAHIVITLRPDGGAQLDVWTGGGLRSDTELRDLGGRVAAGLFPGKSISPAVVNGGAAFPFARSEITAAYRPDASPRFDVADKGYGRALVAAGFSRYTLTIRFPHVRTSMGTRSRPAGAEYTWTVTPGRPSPSASIVMHPQPFAWGAEMIMVVAALGGVVLGLRSRRRPLVVLGCAAPLVAAVVVPATGGTEHADALGVLGYLSGASLTAATMAPLVVLPLAVVAGIRLLRLRTGAPRGPSSGVISRNSGTTTTTR